MKNFNIGNGAKGMTQPRNPEMERVDAKCREAEQNVQNAIQELGKTYYDANKDNTAAEYYEYAVKIKECMDRETLWRQYRLRLEDQVQCEKCGAVITSNSLFCNLCGNSIPKWDFSSLDIGSPAMVPSGPDSASAVVCRGCGRPLLPGAAFCEGCGMKV